MKNYGYIPEPILIEKDYVLGGYGNLGGLELQPDGKWDAFMPQIEHQNLHGIEPFACVSFTTTNAVEILARRKFNTQLNLSDRFLAKISGTDTLLGNSPQKVAETLRKMGDVPEALWPFTENINSFQKYYERVPEAIRGRALEFVAEYEFKHEYVNPSPAQLIQGLKHSPLGVSVYAWHKDDKEMYFKPLNTRDNHFTTLFSFEEGYFWRIFDSYDSSVKFLRWDYQFGTAKRYALNRQVVNKDAWAQFLFWFKKAWGF